MAFVLLSTMASLTLPRSILIQVPIEVPDESAKKSNEKQLGAPISSPLVEMPNEMSQKRKVNSKRVLPTSKKYSANTAKEDIEKISNLNVQVANLNGDQFCTNVDKCCS